MPLFGEGDLDEVGHEDQFLQRRMGVCDRDRLGAERHTVCLSFRDPVPLQDTLRHLRIREAPQRAAEMPIRIALLQTPRDDEIEGRPRYDAQLAVVGDRIGELPR